MIVKKKALVLICGLLIAALLGGCGAAQTPAPTPFPTVDTRPTMDAVSTQAVQTAIANLTLMAPTATPVTPTPAATDTPQPTETPAITNTPVPSETPTRVFIPWTKTPTATQVVYGCTITSVSPNKNDTIKVDQDFDAKWTIKNNGINTWNAGNTDIRFVDGTKLQKSKDLYDLGADVAPNGTYTVTVDMRAPSSDGTYSTTWGIYLEDGSVCSLPLTINVSK